MLCVFQVDMPNFVPTNTTPITTPSSAPDFEKTSFWAEYLYSLSYCHVATVTVMLTWIFGYIASIIAG